MSTPPFQGSRFLGCSRALLPRQFPAGAAAPALISEHPPGLRHPPGTGARCEGPTLLCHPSVHPSLCPKARGFGACRAARGGGQCWEPPPPPPARAVTEPLFRRFRRPMLAGAQLSPRPPALQRSSSREVFFGMGPLAPRPDAGTRPRHRGRKGQRRPRWGFCSGTSGHRWVPLGPLSPKTLWREQRAVALHEMRDLQGWSRSSPG